MDNSNFPIWSGFYLGLALMCTSFTAIALTAYSVRDQELLQEGDRTFWQVRVTCTDIDTKRFIERPNADSPWCSREIATMCAADRVELAIEVCSTGYRIALEEQQELEIAKEKRLQEQLQQRRSALRKRQSAVQRQREQLAQRKVNLRRKEIDLQQRELELANRLSALENGQR